MATNISNSMSNLAILSELGDRMRARRLRLNHTQEETALQAGVSVGTIKNLEKGVGTLLSFIAVLRVLDLLDQLDIILPQQSVSPLAIFKHRSKTRQRARSSKNG